MVTELRQSLSSEDTLIVLLPWFDQDFYLVLF